MKRERNTFQANERERGGETTVVRISSVAAAAAVPTLYTTYNISLADAVCVYRTLPGPFWFACGIALPGVVVVVV
jgi:hypothetical protein